MMCLESSRREFANCSPFSCEIKLVGFTFTLAAVAAFMKRDENIKVISSAKGTDNMPAQKCYATII